MSNILIQWALDKRALADPNEDVPISFGEKVGNGIKAVGSSITDAAKDTGKHMDKYKKEYAGAAIGGLVGVPTGIAVSNFLNLSPTEKVITIIASSGIMAGVGSHVMKKYASDDNKESAEPGKSATTDKPKEKTWYNKALDGVTDAAKATGKHLSDNRWTYLGGAGGTIAGGAGGMVVGDMFNMSPAEKLTTVIAMSIAGGATGAVVGSKYNPKA